MRQQISEADREYINELLLDFEDRRRETPEELFEQLSHLSVGPLVTDSVAWREATEEAFAEAFGLCLEPA